MRVSTDVDTGLVAPLFGTPTTVVEEFDTSPPGPASAPRPVPSLDVALQPKALGMTAPDRGLRASLHRATTWTVVIATVAGSLLRLAVPRGLWLDETISVHDARLPYLQMLHVQALTDVHPPLYFTLLWASGRVFGFGELAVRLPSIALGVVFIPLVYLLGKEAYDRRTGAVASVLVTVAPLLVWYSQEARMYMLLMTLGVLALWAQLRILRRAGVGLDGPAVAQAGWGGALPWAVYTLATVGLAWTQYFGLWLVAFQQALFLGILVVRWRRGRSFRSLAWAWGVTAAVALAAYLPLAGLARQQFSVHQATGQAFGVAVPGVGHIGLYSVLANIAWGILGYHSNVIMPVLVALWPIGMLIALGLLGRRLQPVSYVLVGAVLVPLGLMFGLGQAKANLFEIRYMSTIVPVLFLLIARSVTSMAASRRVTAMVVAGLVVVLAVGLVDQQYSSSNPRRYDFREALHLVDAQARPGDVILYRPVDLWSVTDYYSPGVRAEALTGKPTVPTPGHKVFVVTSVPLMDGTTDNSTTAHAVEVLRSESRLLEQRSFPNVQVQVFG